MAAVVLTSGVDLPAEPKAGDLVHVAGHGPGVVLTVEGWVGSPKFQVQYPDGTKCLLTREQILAHEAIGDTSAPAAGDRVPQVGPISIEYLACAFDDAKRSLPLSSATFSLVATMVGGGVLSLPYAMSQCGMVLGTIALIVSALASMWTMDMLIQCARCTGRDTFELVGHAALGEGARKVTVMLIFLICWLTQVAYFVLLADLLTPTANLVAPGLVDGKSPVMVRRLVVTAAALLLSPMCFKSSLSALRFLCFASVGSVFVVGAIVGFRAAQHVGQQHDVEVSTPSHEARSLSLLVELAMFPADWSKALYVFPMFGVSFLCHFNVLPTHEELHQPNWKRVRRMLALCLAFTTALYFFVGTAGYVFAGSCTCGNILLNFTQTDPLVATGRAALALVLMLNFPLICQPCRNALFRLMSDYGRGSSLRLAEPGEQAADRYAAQEAGAGNGAGGLTADGRTARLVAPAAAANGDDGAAQVHAYRLEDTASDSSQCRVRAVDAFTPKDNTVQQSAGLPSLVQRCVLTTAILVSALFISLVLQSILVVWSILGSTVAFLIAFILPAGFWKRLVGPRAGTTQRRAAEALIVICTVLAVVCTVLTCMNLSAPPCPPQPVCPLPDVLQLATVELGLLA